MIGDHKWISRLKRSSSKYKVYEIIFKLKSKLDSLDDYKLIFYLSALISHFQINKNFDFYINIDDMIFLSPDYKYLLEDEKLDESNIDFKLSLDNATKLINIGTNNLDINSKSLFNIEEDFLIFVRDKGPDDNLILILPKPLIKYDQKGGEFVHNNNSVNLPGMQAGVGYNPTVHTRKGYDIGQYFAASLDIDDVSTEHQDHNSNQYPGDPLFGVKKLEGLIDQKKKNANNFEKGFSVGFDNGYNKGYYFGYSSAAAYLYRYYKKFYKEYMEKYKEKLIEKETNENYENYYDDPYYNENMSGGFWEKKEEEKKVFINDQLTKLTGHDFTYEPFLDKDKIEELDKDPMYKGLPDYMMPENTFSLVALQPRKHSILELVSQFFLPTKKFANPSLHCKKPSKDDLDHMFRLNFHPKFRDGIVSADKNWNDRIFRKSCNKYSLMLMKYCPNDLHRGVEYDTKTGYFYKVCKRKKDENRGCIIM